MRVFLCNLLLSSVLMTVLAALLALFCRLIKTRTAAAGRYAAWMVLLPGFLFPVRPGWLPSFWPPSASSTGSTAAYTTGLTAESTAVNPWPLLFGLWLLGMLAMLIWTFVRHSAFCRMVRRCACPPSDPRTTALIQETLAHHANRSVPVMECPGIASPMLLGLLRPRILLPRRSYEEEELRLILRHELTHFRRGDVWFRLLTTIARCLHWFNPGFLLIDRAICRACEAACDEAVVREASPSQKKLYCVAILRAETMTSSGQSALSTAFSSRQEVIRRRLVSILHTGQQRRSRLLPLLVGLVVVLSGMFLQPSPPAAADGVPPATSEPQEDGTLVTGTTSAAEDPNTICTTVVVEYPDNQPVQSTAFFPLAPTGYPAPEPTHGAG